MKVLWFNTTSSTYEFGTWVDFQTKQLNTTRPEEILALEKFTNASSDTLRKIAMELNKCRLSRLR